MGEGLIVHIILLNELFTAIVQVALCVVSILTVRESLQVEVFRSDSLE